MMDVEYVLWQDAVSEDAWKHRSDISPHYHKIQSIGVLIAETDQVLTLGLNHDLTEDNFSCFIHIPKVMILARHKIRGHILAAVK